MVGIYVVSQVEVTMYDVSQLLSGMSVVVHVVVGITVVSQLDVK